MVMEGFVIKGFARSLTIINDQKYDGCYMAKANTNKKDKLQNIKFWRMISKEEVYDFSKYTNDINSIHLNSNPIV